MASGLWCGWWCLAVAAAVADTVCVCEGSFSSVAYTHTDGSTLLSAPSIPSFFAFFPWPSHAPSFGDRIASLFFSIRTTRGCVGAGGAIV